MSPFWKYLYRIDYILLILTISLMVFGLITLYGATINQEHSPWLRQLVWVIFGAFCMITVLLVDYRWVIRYSLVFYLFAIFLLCLCYTPLGASETGANNALRWLRFPGVPFKIQPAEIAKLATILYLAKWLSARKLAWNSLLDVFIPLTIGALPALLIMKQPDLGTAVVFAPITVIMMFVAGMPFSYLLCMFTPLFCLLGIFHDIFYILLWVGLMTGALLCITWEKVPWHVCAPFLAAALAAYVGVYQFGEKFWDELPAYKKGRLLTFVDPGHDPRGASYNFLQAKIALGSGGFWGKGFGEGTQSKLGFVPEFEHDFVFAAMGEQMGFLGGATLLGIFLLLIIRGLDTAVESKTTQGSLIACGIVGMFFTHILINVGMVTGLLPVTGLPLTFISYGGTFMITNLLCIGLLLNVRMRSGSSSPTDHGMGLRSTMSIPTKYNENFSEF